MVLNLVNHNCLKLLKNLDEVKHWFRYMGKEFDPISPVTGVKKTYDDAIEEGSAYFIKKHLPNV